MAFALRVGFGNLLGLGGFERHNHALDPVHPGAGHVEDVFVEAGFGLIQFQQFEDLGLRLLLGLPFGEESGFFGNSVFQDESGELGQGLHSAQTLSQFRRKVKPTRCWGRLRYWY
jgi:hypothetical protein